jgi:hypothetical protein
MHQNISKNHVNLKKCQYVVKKIAESEFDTVFHMVNQFWRERRFSIIEKILLSVKVDYKVLVLTA